MKEQEIYQVRREYYDEDAVTSIKKIIVKEGITGLGDYCFAVDYPQKRYLLNYRLL